MSRICCHAAAISCVILVPTWPCCRMLRHKFFHRAKKVPVSEQELKAKLKKKEKERKHGGEEKCIKEDDKGDADAEISHAEGEKKEEKATVLFVSYGAQNVVVMCCCNLMWWSTHALLTLQSGVTSTARHSENISCRGVTSTARHVAHSHSLVYISTTSGANVIGLLRACS